MTITPHALTVSRKNAAVSATINAHTTDPGVISITYPTGITGPEAVTVAGTRMWGNMGSGGDYAALISSVANGRLTTTIFLEVDVGRALAASQCANNGITTILPVFGSIRTDLARRLNWMLYLRSSLVGGYALGYAQSASSSSVEAFYIRTTGYTLTAGKIRFAVVLDDGTGGVGSVLVYTGARANVDSLSRAATSGTMGGTEALVLTCGSMAGKISRAATDGELDTWFGGGDIPATNREVYYPGNEIDPSIGVVYDSVGTNDLGPNDITGWQAADLLHPHYTDTGFTTPAFSIPLTIAADCAAGDHTITLRRTRVGVPSRTPPLSDAELYDDGSATVTVTVESESVTIGPDVDCKVDTYPATIDLLISSNYDGAATVVSDDANLVPTSPVTIADGVAVVACTVTADVTGATVTATGPGGDIDTCAVTVAEVPPSAVPLTIGPDQTLDALVDEIYLHLTGEDGSVSISSVPAFGLSGLPAVASIVDGVATVTVRRMTAGTYTITATQGTSSASCTITIPSVLVPSDDYDLRLDLADIIEAIQVPADRSAYHYDETMKSDGEALDAEDGTFALHVIQTVDGPIIGGSTAVVLVQVAVESEPDHADMERFREAIHEARCPAYVSSIYCESGDVTPMRGAYLVQYMMQVQLA